MLGSIKVTVVTVCYNALDDLMITVESVSRQRWDNLNHVIVDANSTDGTLEFLNMESKRLMAWVSEPDSGIYNAMNKGIDLCPDDTWVIFLNAGDRFASDSILENIHQYLAGDFDILIGGVAISSAVDSGRSLFPVRNDSDIGMPGCHQSQFIRAKWLKTHRFDESYIVGADFEFYLRSRRNRAKVILIPEIVSEIAPEGFSAKNENILQRDYVRAISRNSGNLRAAYWLILRQMRLFLKRLFIVLKRID